MSAVHPAPDPFRTLSEDYAAAAIRLTWAVDRSSNDRILLCGCVELIPREVPPPEPTAERYLVLNRDYFLYAHDVVVPPQRGLQWFDDTETGRCVRIQKTGELPETGDP